jgi:hypothetical protein
LDAPVLVIVGNHDLGFDGFFRRDYGMGWKNFAAVFHPFRVFTLSWAGWRLVGFDSGASVFSPRILTRGLDERSLEDLARRLDGGQKEAGVVLFSHAPTRAVLSRLAPLSSRGTVGRMRNGARELETLLLAAARRGQRVVHLSGHTHWSEIFVANHETFVRTSDRSLSWREGGAALVNTQSATHDNGLSKASARGFGFTLLVLSRDALAVDQRRVSRRD